MRRALTDPVVTRRQVYGFGDFALSVATRELRRGAGRVVVPPRIFDCLVYLIEHRDRAVGRDELIAAVWGRTDVADGLLAQTILRARRVVDESAGEQKWIRTVPGFGYRWVGVIDDVPADRAEPRRDPAEAVAVAGRGNVSARPTTDEAPPIAVERPRRSRRLPMGLVLGALALVAGLAAVFLRDRPDRRPSDAGAAGLSLVLPFVTSGDQDIEWTRVGLMDLVAQRLRGAGSNVVGSGSVLGLVPPDGASLDAAGIEGAARALDANLVIAGHVAKSDAGWQVALRTVAGQRPPLNATGQAADPIAAADAAAGQLIVLLGLDGTRRHAADDVDALQQKMQAAVLVTQFEVAQKIYDDAAPLQRADPRMRYELARLDLGRSRLADARANLVELAGRLEGGDASLLRAKVLVMLSSVSLRDEDFRETEAYADAAIQALGDDRSSTANGTLGGALIGRATGRFNQGRFDEAIDDFSAARMVLATSGDQRLLGTADINLGNLYIKLDRFTESIPFSQRAAELFQRLRSPGDELMARINLACAGLVVLDLPGTEKQLARLLELARVPGDEETSAYADIVRAEVLQSLGRVSAAQDAVAALLAAAPALPPRVAARIHGVAARIAWANADARAAFEHSGQSLAFAWGSEEPRDFARVWLARVRSSRWISPEATPAQTRAAMAWAAAGRSAVAKTYGLLFDAEQLARGGRDDEAASRYAEATRAAENGGVPIDRVEVAVSFARWLVSRGDLARASAVLGRIVPWAAVSFDTTLVELQLYRALGNGILWEATLKRARQMAGERGVPDVLRRPPDAEAVGGR